MLLRWRPARRDAKAPIVGSNGAPVRGFGVGPDGLMLPGGAIPLDRMPVMDPAYRVNLTAAAVAAMEMGADLGSVGRVVGRFRHRRPPPEGGEGVGRRDLGPMIPRLPTPMLPWRRSAVTRRWC